MALNLTYPLHSLLSTYKVWKLNKDRQHSKNTPYLQQCISNKVSISNCLYFFELILYIKNIHIHNFIFRHNNKIDQYNIFVGTMNTKSIPNSYFIKNYEF